MSEPTITQDELLRELERFREPVRESRWTEEMEEVLRVARENPKPVPYPKIALLWKKRGWGYIPPTTLSSHYNSLKRKFGDGS